MGDNPEPTKTFREFSRYVGRMANRKASGDDKIPADLFKKAPEAFWKRAWILIHIIFAGHYVCSEKLLEARVVLLGPWQPNSTSKLQTNCILQLVLPTHQHHHYQQDSEPHRKVRSTGILATWLQRLPLCPTCHSERTLALKTSHETRHQTHPSGSRLQKRV